MNILVHTKLAARPDTNTYSRIDHRSRCFKNRDNDKETMKLELMFMIENFIFKLGCSNSEKSLKMRGNSRLILK